MAYHIPYLCVVPGTSSLKAAQFDLDPGGRLRLRHWTVRSLGPAGMIETARRESLARHLREVLGDPGFTARHGQVCVSGGQVFAKVVQLPPLEGNRLARAMEFEARQNVPFPLAQTLWDYAVLEALPDGGLEALLVATKTEVVEGLIAVAANAGLRLDLADAAPAALANAFGYNYPSLEGCSLILDLGAKTSQVLLIDEGRFLARTLNLGGQAITQEFAAEAKLSLAEAERYKLAEGCVGLGGAYAEPEGDRAAALSKVARHVMTRLQVQVSQSIQYYRAHHQGSAPERLFLAGSAAGLPWTGEFFAEKLNLPVEYFNPFRNVSLGPEVDRRALARMAHSLGEVVGLGLRTPTACPLELNLMPKGVRQRLALKEKRPYLVAAVCSLVAVLAGLGGFFDRCVAVKRATFQQRAPVVERLRERTQKMEAAWKRREAGRRTADAYGGWMGARYHWAELIADLRRVLTATEAAVSSPGLRANVWIERMAPEGVDVPEEPAEEENPPQMAFDAQWWRRYGRYLGWREGQPVPSWLAAATHSAASAPRPTSTTPTNEISVINLTCRAVSWRQHHPAADTELVYALLRQLEQSPYFEKGANATQLSGPMAQDPETGTFTFGAKIKLKRPLAL